MQKHRQPFNIKLQAACETAAAHSTTTQEQQDLINGISEFGTKTGYVTKPQLSLLGRIYKNTVNGGVFVKHDWW